MSQRIPSVFLRLVLFAVVGCPTLLGAQEVDLAGEIRLMVADLDRALEARDVEATMSHFAPLASVQSIGCGKAPERMTRTQFQEMLALGFGGPGRYEIERQNDQVQILGSGPIATFKSTITETIELGDFQQSGRSQETIFLNKIKGRYLLTSLRSQEICE